MSARIRRPALRLPRPSPARRAAWSRLAARPVPRFARRHLLPWIAVLIVTAAGAGVGFALAPGASTYVGPLQTEVRVRPSLTPGVEVDLPPVGKITFDTHRAPVVVTANVESVDVDAAARLVRSPQQLLALELTAADTVRDATVRAATHSLLCGFGGALLAAVVVFRGRRRTLQTGATLLVLVVATGAGTWATLDPSALRQPRFTGLLSRAPYVVSSTQNALDRLESYRSGLSDIVRSVSTLYAAAANLPVLGDAQDGPTGLGADVTTVLHISDLHLNPLGYDLTENLVEQFGVQAVVDTGDTTTLGSEVESSFLGRIGGLDVPYVWVRGNHDSTQTQEQVAAQGAVVLDQGAVTEVAGLVLAGQGDPVFTPDGEGEQATGSAEEIQERANEVLAGGIEDWERANPDEPVDAALVHDPSGLQPLLGRVPLVLAGHLHKRSVTLDASGTRIMVEGTTGGAGITSAGLDRLADGSPLPLSATLLYFARSGDRAGELLAYDEVTVGGLGLAEVNLQRTVLTEEDRPPLTVPDPSATTGTATTTGTSTGTGTGSTGGASPTESPLTLTPTGSATG
ncbi:metallophosphoesterase [Kineococcus sp. LSe6-4]|uniref:Metallophosphoesterase n=1 Tax=Kineococcus halophytocola TaxID=3234027 RepID=A0ABV4H1A9_9ACTN